MLPKATPLSSYRQRADIGKPLGHVQYLRRKGVTDGSNMRCLDLMVTTEMNSEERWEHDTYVGDCPIRMSLSNGRKDEPVDFNIVKLPVQCTTHKRTLSMTGIFPTPVSGCVDKTKACLISCITPRYTGIPDRVFAGLIVR